MTTNSAETKYNVLSQPSSSKPLDHVFTMRRTMTMKEE